MSAKQPLDDYHTATRALADHLEAAEHAADARCIALAHLHQTGHSYTDLARLAGISRQRVGGMVQRGRQLEGHPRLIRLPATRQPRSAKPVPLFEPVDF